jgi:tetratricopeptide (TPR) repeat protein
VLANRDKAQILCLAGRYEECAELSRRTLELDPYAPLVHNYLGRAYEYLGRPREAVEAYVAPLAFSEENRDSVAALRTAADRGGMKGFWKQRLQLLLEEPVIRPYSVALAYVRLGEPDLALPWLEKLYEERGGSIRALKVNADWDPLRADPRFQDLLRRTNLVESAAR